MKPSFLQKTFYRRVLVWMIAFAVLPSILVGLISNSAARQAMRQIALENSSTALARACQDLDDVFEDTYNIGVVIANDIDIQSILRSCFASLSQQYSADLRGDTRLNFISSYKKDIYGLYVIGANGCKHKSRFTSFKDGDFTQEEWYRAIIQADGPIWFGRHDGSFVVNTIGDSLISGGFAVISLRVSKRLTKPIQTLRSAMRSVRHGDLTVAVEAEGKDELGQLSRSFNAMVSRLHELMEKSLQDESRRRKAELIALQSQINPHFLYNTLDTVVWMARQRDTEGIVGLVMALTHFFRISLSKGRDFIPLSDELAHVTSYLTIQKVRYQSTLQYQVEVEADCMSVLAPKLILQPIVENAIYHGLKLKEQGGVIYIRGRMDGENLMMEVEDTGLGMLPERLREVQREMATQSEEGNGYGLRNIHQRLMLCYGPEYGLRIESEYLLGTVVSFRIPVNLRRKTL